MRKEISKTATRKNLEKGASLHIAAASDYLIFQKIGGE